MGCGCSKKLEALPVGKWLAAHVKEPQKQTSGASNSGCDTPCSVELEAVVSRAASRLGRAGVSGRYHRLPRRLEEDYVLEDCILGSGFNGDVVRSRSRRTGAAFAVKAFRLRGISKEKMEVLKTEAEIFLMMDHPHVARLVDVYESERFLYLIMECMEGGELFERLVKVKTFCEDDAADAVWQMLLAVNYIHNRGVVHRDLKLENFLYEKPDSDQLKLIDFGFSHIWDPNTNMAASCGTLSYAAPEVLGGNYTSKCDLWSLGVIAFILLAGYMPFSGPGSQQAASIKAGRWNYRPERWRKVSKVALDFVRKLLVVCPDQRFSADEALQHPFIADLEKRRHSSTSTDSSVLEALQSFAQASRFRRAIMSLMAWSLTEEERSRVRGAFIAMDENRHGTITLGELRKALSQNFEVTEEQVKPIFDALDTAANEEIHYSEFLAAMVSKRISMHEDMLHSTFQRFDVDKSGYISVENLKEVLGDSFDGVPMEELIKEADFTKNGQVSLDEFMMYLQGDGIDSRCAQAAHKVIDKEAKKVSTNPSGEALQKSITMVKRCSQQPLLARLARWICAGCTGLDCASGPLCKGRA